MVEAATIVSWNECGCTQAHLCGDIHQCWLYPSGQQWVEKLEGSNHASEGVLRADFKHWMPLCVSTREVRKRQNTNHN